MNTPPYPEHALTAGHADGALLNAGPALADSVRTLGSQTRSAVQGFAGDAAQIARDSADAARQRAVSFRDAGNEYLRERPLQSVLIAAGIGALLMLLASLLRHRGGASR